VAGTACALLRLPQATALASTTGNSRMAQQHRLKVGDIGEAAVASKLKSLGWYVEDLNVERKNFPNCDLQVEKAGVTKLIQVKASTVYSWISAGSVNPTVCNGGPVFNRIENAPTADFIICISPAKPVSKGAMPNEWRYFVLPTEIADKLFRINIEAYFNGLKLDGTPRSKRGVCQDYVGPSPFNSGTVPNHHQDYLPYENSFDLISQNKY